MPKFWTRLVDSLPRESKSLTWRAPLVVVVLVLSFLIFLPFQDTPYAVRVVQDTYDEKGRVDPSAELRRPTGSPLLRAGDVVDWQALCTRLKELGAADTPSAGKKVWEALPKDTQAVLASAAEGKAALEPGQKSDLLGRINALLGEPGLVGDKELQGLAVPPEAENILAAHEATEKKDYLETYNRLLLEATFPKELSRMKWGNVGGRQVISYWVTNRWVWLTNWFHYEIERDVATRDLKPEGGRARKQRTLEVVSRGLNLGLDLSGGTELLYRILHDPGAKGGGVSAEDIKAVVQRRIDAYGLREVRIQAQGADRLLVQLPGQEAAVLETLKSVIQNIGHLEFRLVAPESERYEPYRVWRDTGKAPPGWTEYSVRSLKEERYVEQKILVNDQAEMTGEPISSTWVDTTGSGRHFGPCVMLRFTGQGERDFARITGDHIGEQLAIILNTVRDAENNIAKDDKGALQKGTCYSAPRIDSRIFGTAVITGDFTVKECEALCTVLRAGSLPAPLKLEHENSVGASLGSALINKGVVASIIGTGAVILFMTVYYLLPGLLADFTMVLNVIMLVAVMILFDATLTLPGIAGLALTVGMAVDANVLIFERIREEMGGTTEKPLRLAVREGFDRAFTTIFDSNLTTIITAVILLWVGTGSIKGFGLTLTIGLLINIFTAVVVARVVFDIVTWRRWVSRLPMLQLFTRPNFRFMALRWKAVSVSAVLIVVGMAVFFWRGRENWDIDFRGGTMLHAVFRTEMAAEDITRRLQQIGPEFAQAEVQSLASAAQEGRAFVGHIATEFEIRVPSLSEAAIGTIASTLITSPGSLEITFTLATPATLDEVKEKTKGTNFTIEPSGPAGVDGKQAAFKLTASAINVAQVRADLEKALGAPLATSQVVKRTVNYASEAPVECDRPVALAEIERELRVMDPDVKVEPQGPEEGKGAYSKFLIRTTLAEPTAVRIGIERAFVAISFKAKILKAFKDDLAPQGIETLATKDGRTTLALNLTKPIEPALLDGKLASWALEATAKPVPEGQAGPAGKFEITLPSARVDSLGRRIAEDPQTFLLSDPVPRVAKVGPAVAQELLVWAIVGVVASWFAIIAYVWLRFERIKYGVAGVLALVHDVLITMGFLAVTGRKFNITIIAALLTIIGYSINDTIVIFDRIRENLRKERRRDVDADIIDLSINQTLSRSIITSVTTFLAVLSLFMFAGGVIQDFALTMLLGIITGSYSTIFIAAPVLILRQQPTDKRLARAQAAPAAS